MTPERWQRIKDVFEGAAARTGAARAAFLAQACDGDDDLRVEVEALLAADLGEDGVLAGSVAGVLGDLLPGSAPETAPASDAQRIGRYRILHEIGRGGMAVVYAAVRDDRQFHQQVAIKLIRRGMDSAHLVARLRQERQILANLDHPNIARLLDGGVTEDGGLPYLVMEHIEGDPIDAYCERLTLDVAARLRLFRDVCAAVHYAHQNLVVHRDLKPSNILVTAGGVPKLLDFGIAKLLEPDRDGPLVLPTVEGIRPMTPGYASPEQIRGEAITTASDVYSLGVLLYRLLARREPYRIDTFTHAALERAVCEQEPRPPSAVATHAAAAADDERWRRVLRGDLDNIVLMAMRKRAENRYASAAALSEDVRRHLDGLPVAARKPTTWYRAGKFVRRHRLGVAAAALVVLSLVAGIVATAWQARVARAERQVAEWTLDFMVRLFEVSHPGKSLGETVTARQLLDEGAERLERAAGPPRVEATLMDSIGVAYFNLGLYDQAAPLLEEALDLRRATLTDDDLRIAESLHHLGRLRALREGRLEAAEADLRAALKRRRAAGAPAADVAETENELALILIDRNALEEAEILLREALARYRRTLGAGHEQVAAALNNLALLERTLERWPEAEALYREALALDRARLGEAHPRLAVTLANLGVVLREQGRCEEAEPIFRRALELERKFLPAAHPSTAVTESNLALCVVAGGELEAAEGIMRAALERLRSALDPARRELAMVLNNLGNLRFRMRAYDEAQSLLGESLTIYLEAFGPDHRDVADVRNNLGTVLLRMGDPAAAEAQFELALEVNQSLLGIGKATIARNLNNLASTRARLGRPAEAVELFRQALAIREQELGADSPVLALSRKNLAEVLLEIGGEAALAEAEALYRQALQVLAGDGGNARQALIVRLGLAQTLLARGRAAEAEAEARELWAAWQQTPRGIMGTAVSRSILGASLSAQGRAAEAEEHLRAALAALEDEAGPQYRAAQRRLEEHQERRLSSRSRS